jgi:hypothetical protein
MLHRQHGADVKGPGRPDTDRRRQSELDERPSAHAHELRHRLAWQQVTEGAEHQRDGERRRKPEAPGHIPELGIVLLPPQPRLQRHAAKRAGPRAIAHNLRVHRAHPFGRPSCGRHRDGLQCHSTLRAIARASLQHLGMHRQV